MSCKVKTYLKKRKSKRQGEASDQASCSSTNRSNPSNPHQLPHNEARRTYDNYDNYDNYEDDDDDDFRGHDAPAHSAQQSTELPLNVFGNESAYALQREHLQVGPDGQIRRRPSISFIPPPEAYLFGGRVGHNIWGAVVARPNPNNSETTLVEPRPRPQPISVPPNTPNSIRQEEMQCPHRRDPSPSQTLPTSNQEQNSPENAPARPD